MASIILRSRTFIWLMAFLPSSAQMRVQWVREAVARNPKTPRETLKRLASDPDQSVARAAKIGLG